MKIRHAATRKAPFAAGARRRLLAACLLAGWPVFGRADGGGRGAVLAVEYQVKAAFLCKFGSYVEWPAQAFGGGDAPFIIGVAGTDAVADELRRIAANQTVNGRPLGVRQIGRGDAVDALHVLFIARSAAARTAELLAAVQRLAVLTVTEEERESGVAGMINFVVVDDKVRFDVALQAAEARQLKISARLLQVARRVAPRA